jgi:ABC-2 type transport system permease protein
MTTLTRPVATAPGTVRPARSTGFVGTRRLTAFTLRRDRVRTGVWAVSIGGMIAYFGVAIPVVYPDAAARQTRAALMADPSGAFMTGPGYGLDEYTFGAMIANEMLGMIAVAVALMSIFLVVRHTRAEEEAGRADLVRATVVGRYAALTAALLTLVVANAVVAAVLLGALAVNGLALADSAAVAAGAAMVGLVFGAVAAVTSQLSEHARTASGLAGALLGLTYVLRGVGDAAQLGGSALSWTSPIAWAQQTRAFVDLRWWPLLVGLAVVVPLVAGAYALVGRRDVGAGLVPARRGPAHAGRRLLSPEGLTWRMERGSIAWWAVGLVVFAVLTGSMGQGIVESFEDQPQLAEVFRGEVDGGDVLRATLAAFLTFFAMAVAVYAVIAVNRLARDESEGRTGAVLATGVSRPRWLGARLVVTGLGAVVLLLTCGFGLGLGAGSSTGDTGLVAAFPLAGLAYLPVVACFVGLATLAHGLRAGTWWVWTLLVASIVVGLYGPLLNLPMAVLDVAPFGLVPAVPYEALDAGPLTLLTVAGAVLVALGTVAYRRRDLEA